MARELHFNESVFKRSRQSISLDKCHCIIKMARPIDQIFLTQSFPLSRYANHPKAWCLTLAIVYSAHKSVGSLGGAAGLS